VIKFRVLDSLPIRRTGSYAKKYENIENDAEEIRYEISELSFIAVAGMHASFFLNYSILSVVYLDYLI
jgi:hypothetical protein